VDELVRNDRVPRSDLLFEAPDGGGRQEGVAAQHLEAADVRAVVDFRRSETMAAAMARAEDHRRAREAPDEIGVGGFAERRIEFLFAEVFDARQIVDAASADQPDPARAHEEGPSDPAACRCRSMAARISRARTSASRPTSPDTSG